MIAKTDNFRSLLPFALRFPGAANFRGAGKPRHVRSGHVRQRRIGRMQRAIPAYWGRLGRDELAMAGSGGAARSASFSLIVFKLGLFDPGDHG